MGKISHCGKNLLVENRYAVTNHPSYGDETYFDYAFCQNCGNHVHAYYYVYFRKKQKTETWISDKHNRHVFQGLITNGQAFIIPGHQDEIPRNTRAQVLAGEWTLNTKKPADFTASYISRNESVIAFSTQAGDSIRRKREKWLRKYLNGRIVLSSA